MKERTPQPGHAINLRAVRCRGNKEPSRRALAGAKNRGPTRQVRATLADDIRHIGKLLNVKWVLEGSVRKAGCRLRVKARLINVADGYNLWSETYHRHIRGVFAAQEELSQAIVDALRMRFVNQNLERIATQRTTRM